MWRNKDEFPPNSESNLVLLDLGSGDGRVPIAAAESGLFGKAVGVELNL